MRAIRIFAVSFVAGVTLGAAGLAAIDRARVAAAAFRITEIRCLAENVYYEARGEPLAGQYAVAEVTMNRVVSPAFPASVCGVVHAGRWDEQAQRRIGAFSWTARAVHETPYGYEWRRAQAVASTVYDSDEAPLVDGALFYHATYVTPAWAHDKIRIARIGRHLFYE